MGEIIMRKIESVVAKILRDEELKKHMRKNPKDKQTKKIVKFLNDYIALSKSGQALKVVEVDGCLLPEKLIELEKTSEYINQIINK